MEWDKIGVVVLQDLPLRAVQRDSPRESILVFSWLSGARSNHASRRTPERKSLGPFSNLSEADHSHMINGLIEANVTQILKAWHKHCGEDR